MALDNRGLILGLSEGLKGYIQGKEMARQRDADAIKLKLAAAQQGYNLDDSGSLVQDESGLDAEKQGLISSLKFASPDFGTDKDQSGLLQAIQGAKNKKDLTSIAGYAKPNITGTYGLMGANIRADATKSLAAPRVEQVKISKANQAAHVADTFNKDPLIKNFSQTQATINNGVYSIDNPPEGRVTNQLLSETSMAVAKALAGSAAVAQGTIHEQTYKTAMSDLAKIKSYISGKPEDVASPATVKHVRETLSRLHEIAGLNIENRKSEVGEGLEDAYAGNEAALKVLNKKKQTDKGKGLVGQKSNLSPEDQQALDWAKANPKDPRAQQILALHPGA